MARFIRGGESYDVWLEPGPEDRPWDRQLMTRPPSAAARGKTSYAESRAYVRALLGRYAAGWTRVVDPLHEPADLVEPVEPTLEAATHTDPDDVATRLVYGDWLLEQQHPRGALIAIQHARTVDDSPALEEREAAWLAEHEAQLLGELAPQVRRSGASKSDAGVELTWERGFVRRARIDGSHDRGDSEDLLWRLLRHPSLRFLRELELGCHHAGDQDNELMCAVLTHVDNAPPLRVLRIGDFDEAEYDGIDISRAPLGDLTLLSIVYPRLEDVMLKGTGSVELGGIDLPRARRFALKTSTLTASTAGAIAAARWPALEDLELWFGDDEYGGDCQIADIAPLFERERVPALRALRVMNTTYSDAVIEPLARSSLAPHIEVLDLALGTFSDDGATLLLRHRDAFPALRELNVFACALTPEGLLALRRAGVPVVERPPSPGHWAGNERWTRQKTGRYCSVRE